MYQTCVVVHRMSNQYNLRKRRRNSAENISLPIQVQLSDVAFMSELLGSSHPPSAQPDPADNMSGSDQSSVNSLDHSGTDSEPEQTGNVVQTEENSDSQAPSASTSMSTQDVINQ